MSPRKQIMTAQPLSADRPGLRWIGTAFFLLTLALGTTLAALALWVQLAGPAQFIALAALAAGVTAALVLRWRSRRAGWAVLLTVFGLTGLWYETLKPAADAVWAPDVAHGVTGLVDGDQVTLRDVRNFRWIDEDHANEAWETRTYDLSQLSGVDMFTSVWDNPDIAHLLVSFGFTSGQHVVFSVEIRRKAGEEFSTIGGFFRQFEQVLIAADEEDIVKLRTNYRKEDVSLYPLNLSPETMRGLFLSYVKLGNDLAAKPAFYNTITANCASTVYRIAQPVTGKRPFDIRLLETGLLPEYLQDLGALSGNMPMSERRARAAITARAQALPSGADFSAGIRAE